MDVKIKENDIAQKNKENGKICSRPIGKLMLYMPTIKTEPLKTNL